MNQDCFFAIGRTHRICQDYALSGKKNDLSYAMVSDGCSSSKDTDFGSRFLCKAAEDMVYTSCDPDENPGLILQGSIIRASAYGRGWNEFPDECLDATLLTAKIYKNNSVQVCVSGDGVVAARRRDGIIVIKSIHYKDNAPYYLSYHFDQARKKLLLDTYDCTKTVKTCFLSPDGKYSPVNETSLEDWEIFNFPIEEFSHISIMSDGVESFHRIIEKDTTKTTEPVSIEEILPDLLSYKGDTGAFVQRRCQKFLKECGDAGIYHDDDFSIATISV